MDRLHLKFVHMNTWHFVEKLHPDRLYSTVRLHPVERSPLKEGGGVVNGEITTHTELVH